MAEPESAAPATSSTTVRARFRPRSSKEAEARCVDFCSDCQIGFTGPDGTRHSFTFDKVYGESTSQSDVFADLRPIVEAALQGYNGTIMAYGQTGSGKTHTLIGQVSSPQLVGVVPRAIRHLATGIEDAGLKEGLEFQVMISVVEIYCERIRDLLEPGPIPGVSYSDNCGSLQVKQDAMRGVYIEGATELVVSDEEQLVEVMNRGLAQRSVAATSMNETSSRSHCIVTVRVDKTLGDGTVQAGKLVMVDLAGSERADRTGAAGTTLVEGSLINKSLSCLSNVIFALTEDIRSGRPRHVPYRDSKLTRVLQDSLGGTARTVLIICCSPCLENSAETLSSLRFGARAKGVQNTIAVNQRPNPERLQQQVEQLRSRNSQLAAELQQLRAAVAMGPPPGSPPGLQAAEAAAAASPTKPQQSANTTTQSSRGRSRSGNGCAGWVVEGAEGSSSSSWWSTLVEAGEAVRLLALLLLAWVRLQGAGCRILLGATLGTLVSSRGSTRGGVGGGSTTGITSGGSSRSGAGAAEAAALVSGIGNVSAAVGPGERQAEALVDVAAVGLLLVGLGVVAGREAGLV